ncbi:MAG: MFS transporter [Anaerolineales bacterium]|nr:MFS transporter [Anaerolineales bacterium]
MKRSLLTQIPIFIATRTTINTAIRLVYPFLPIFGRGLGVELEALSIALTLRSASGLLGPFLASVADSRGRKAGILLGLALFTAGVGVMALWPSFPAFVVMLILSLLGNFVFIPSMQAYLGDRVPYQRRGLVLALTELGWSLSFIIGVPLMGLVIAQKDWKAPYPILAGLGALAILTLSSLLPKDPNPDAQRPGLRRNLRTVLSTPAALAGILIAIAISSSNELINVIFGVWLEQTFAVQVAALAAASTVIGLSELGGEALTGALADRLGKRRAVAIGLVLNCLAVLALPVLASDLNGALLGLFFVYLSFEFTIVSSIPLMTEVLPGARATFMSTFVAGMSIGRGLGALLSPRLYRFGVDCGAFSPLLVNALAAVALNILALFALQALKAIRSEATPVDTD